MELRLGRIEIRICDKDGLTKSERRAVDSYVSSLGYVDLNDLLQKHEYASARELAEDHYFCNTRDYFLSDGRGHRLSKIKINGQD